MIEGFIRRPCLLRRLFHKRAVCGLLFAGAAFAQSSPTTTQTNTTQQAPQIITVPVATPATTYGSSGPDWSRAGVQSTSGNTPADDRGNRSNPYRTPDVPTEFQRLVRQTLGVDLPIFGADLFSNAPNTFAPVGDAQVTPDYVIGTGDEIRISATGQLNQQGTFRVDRGGTISIPDVGTLTVAGLRFSELRPFLRQQIGRVYRNFDLNVSLGQLRSIQVYILGEARQPGAYTVSSLSTLVNALFVSGGIKPQGSLRRIELHRSNNTVSTVDLYDLLLRGDKSKDVPLQPGDIIFVPAAGPQVALAGSVTNPAIYELRGATTARQLLELANGTTSTANAGSVRVESIADAQRSVQNITLQAGGDLPLRGGDIVTVDALSGRFNNAITLRGNVANPGRYQWHTGMRLSDLIPDAATLITRSYYRARNALAVPPEEDRTVVPPADQTGTQPAAQQTTQQGTAPSTTPSATSSTTQANTLPAPQGRLSVSTAPSSGSAGTMATAGTTAEAPTPTATATANSSGGGTTVGDALTQNNGTFAATNELVLSAPDVDSTLR